jgi:hypothetical protein
VWHAAAAIRPMWLLPPLKHSPPCAPSSSVAECIVIHSTPPPIPPPSATLSIGILCCCVLRRVFIVIHRTPPPFPSTVIRYLCPSASSAAVCTVILRRRMHCHPSTAVSTAIRYHVRRHIKCHIHRPLPPCQMAWLPLFATVSTVIPRRVHFIHRRVHFVRRRVHFIRCHVHSHPPPCLLSSAAVSIVIYRHPFPSTTASAAVSIVILRRHVHRRPLPSPPFIRRRFHLYPPPPCPPSSFAISTRHPPPFPSLSSAVGSTVILCLQPCPQSSSGAVTAPSSAVISRRVHSHPLLFQFSSTPPPPAPHVHRHPAMSCLLSSAADTNILHLAS